MSSIKKILGVIPARWGSTRFPGKPLADLCGKPMIRYVCEHAKSAKSLFDVVVATDDERICDAVLAFGGKAVMTRTDHRCGTERCVEAIERLAMSDERLVVINIQGDEPFIQPEQIEALKKCFEDPETQIATLVKPFTEADSWADLENPNTPKVVFDNNYNALLFSRSVIPYLRGTDKSEWLKQHTYFRHIGMYAYRAEVLKAITKLPQTALETAESLEQLRWLENGYNIKVAITHSSSVGIDTPEDLKKAEAFIKMETKN